VCSASFLDGDMVSLSAVPSAGTTFVGWAGACGGTGSCSFVMSGPKSVVVTFTNAPGQHLFSKAYGSGLPNFGSHVTTDASGNI
jgi:hypothetical protein